MYHFADKVKYIPNILTNECSDVIDITNIFESLNIKCLNEDGILIVHDFSGMNINMLSKYFSNYTETHSDRIMYDITYGSAEGCFTNMADPINHVLFVRKDDNLLIDDSARTDVKMINFIIHDKTIGRYEEKIGKLKRVRNNILNKFLIYFHNLRRTIIWKQQTAKGNFNKTYKCVIDIRELKLIDHIHNTTLVEAYQKDDIEYVLKILRKFFENIKNEIELLYDVKLNINYDEPNTWMGEFGKLGEN
jgi:hypothetical protein